MIIQYISENHDQILYLLYQHVYLFSFSTLAAVITGIALSLYVTREGKEKIGNIIMTFTATLQAVPPVAVVALVFLFVGIGAKPAIIALFIYSIVPILFNAVSGLLSVDKKMIEAARGIGLTDNQITWKIKFPVAIPVIMAGIRSATTINIGTATVASIIGGGGLGDLIFLGLKLNKNHLILIGAITTSLLAIFVDALIHYLERKITPRGLKVKRS